MLVSSSLPGGDDDVCDASEAQSDGQGGQDKKMQFGLKLNEGFC